MEGLEGLQLQEGRPQKEAKAPYKASVCHQRQLD